MILATLCYVKHNGKTLMVHRNRKPNDMHAGKWNGLGGKFEAGETPEMCIRREVQEEAGLFIQNSRFHGVVTFPTFKGNDLVVFVFKDSEFYGEHFGASPRGS